MPNIWEETIQLYPLRDSGAMFDIYQTQQLSRHVGLGHAQYENEVGLEFIWRET